MPEGFVKGILPMLSFFSPRKKMNNSQGVESNQISQVARSPFYHRPPNLSEKYPF
jgi:hypothetical protein